MTTYSVAHGALIDGFEPALEAEIEHLLRGAGINDLREVLASGSDEELADEILDQEPPGEEFGISVVGEDVDGVPRRDKCTRDEIIAAISRIREELPPRYAYIYDESDVQGPWVLLCEGCISADRHEVSEWYEDDDWRCACCGFSAEDSQRWRPIAASRRST